MLTCLYTCSLGAWGTVYLDLFTVGLRGYDVLLCIDIACVFVTVRWLCWSTIRRGEKGSGRCPPGKRGLACMRSRFDVGN